VSGFPSLRRSLDSLRTLGMTGWGVGAVLLLVAGLAVGVGRSSPTPPHPPRPASAVGHGADAPPPSSCGPGRWTDAAGRCVAAAAAFTAPGARTFWVDATRGHDGADGSRERPWRTVARAAAPGVLGPGDAVLIRAGVYRETVHPHAGGTGPDARVTFAAYPGDAVVVTGADPADDGWTRDGAAWRRAWTGPPLPAYADVRPRPAGEPEFRRELVVAGGVVLRPVYARADLRPGTFFVEGPPDAPGAVVARFPGDRAPREAGPVEVAHRTYLFRPLGADAEPACGAEGTPGWLRVVGLTFRHAANRAQWPAVCAGREGGLVEDVTVEWTNGEGLEASGRGHVLRRVRVLNHGQIGAGGACEGCLVEDVDLVGNNWKGHDAGWEAGGGKWHHTRHTVFRRLYAADNDGPGLWLDGDNVSNTIEGGLFERNAMAGIMLELATTGTLVQHNVVRGTRALGWSGTGILSQAASANALVHNTVTGSAGSGVWLRRDPDRRAPDGHTVVANNLAAGNATGAGAAPDFEGREVMVEADTPAHLRTNRFSGNGWGRRAADDLARSTFYAWPDPPHEAGFRGGDLGRWRRVTGARPRPRRSPACPAAWAHRAPASTPGRVSGPTPRGFGRIPGAEPPGQGRERPRSSERR
jgi:hypothetical protein